MDSRVYLIEFIKRLVYRKDRLENGNIISPPSHRNLDWFELESEGCRGMMFGLMATECCPPEERYSRFDSGTPDSYKKERINVS